MDSEEERSELELERLRCEVAKLKWTPGVRGMRFR